MNYCDNIDCFIYYFLFHYKENQNPFQNFKDWIIEIYENHYIFSNDSIYQLLIILSFLSEISFTLFANLSYHFKLSPYTIRERLIEEGILRESKGYYVLPLFFRDFLNKRRCQSFSNKQSNSLLTVLIQNILYEKNVLFDYLKLEGSPKERFLLENQFIKNLQKKHHSECSEALEKLEPHLITNQRLALCAYLYKEDFHFKSSLVYLVNSFKNHTLYKIISRRINYLLGKTGQKWLEKETGHNFEAIHCEHINCWLEGKPINGEIPLDFYSLCSVFHVPCQNWLSLDFLKGDTSYYSLINLVYQNYLKGVTKNAEKYFYRLLKKYKERLTSKNLDYYFFY